MKCVAVALALVLMVSACDAGDEEADPTRVATSTEETAVSTDQLHRILDVAVSGSPGAYSFNVTAESPDTGCDSYADWWEVVSEDGELLYRRILLHSHVDEQPFTRSGGPIPLPDGAAAFVRLHMNTEGYSPAAVRVQPPGSPEAAELPSGFAAELESLEPQPGDCAF